MVIAKRLKESKCNNESSLRVIKLINYAVTQKTPNTQCDILQCLMCKHFMCNKLKRE